MKRFFRTYKKALTPFLRQSNRWGIWTPKQIFEHVRLQHPEHALPQLTDFVEEVCFSQRVPDEQSFAQAKLLVKAFEEECELMQNSVDP